MRTVGLSKIGLLFATLLATATIAQTVAQPDASAQRRKRGSKDAVVDSRVIAELRGIELLRAEAAAVALGQSKSPQAVNALLDALAMGLHPNVASAALGALVQQSTIVELPASFDVVLFYTRHRNSNVRSMAIKVMGTLNDKRAQATVLAALGDSNKNVRGMAAGIAVAQKNRMAIKPMIELLKKGDEAAGAALAALADADLARRLGELIGSAPDGHLSRCLGAILMRPGFGPEDVRVEVVKALGKIPDSESLEQLTNYLGSIPEKPPRKSRIEAEAIVGARLGG